MSANLVRSFRPGATDQTIPMHFFEAVDDFALSAFFVEFRRRFVSLLGTSFSAFSPHLAFSLMFMDSASIGCSVQQQQGEQPAENGLLDRAELRLRMSDLDLRRVAQYCRNLADLALISDLLPTIAGLYFTARVDTNRAPLDLSQAAVLLGVGLQRKMVDTVATELALSTSQTHALLNKAIRRLSEYFDSICREALEQQQQQHNTNDRQQHTAAEAEGKLLIWCELVEKILIIKANLDQLLLAPNTQLQEEDDEAVDEENAFETPQAQQERRKIEGILGKISGHKLDDDGKTMTYYDFDNGGKEVHVLSTKDTVAIVKNKIQHVIFIPYQTQTLTPRRNHGKALEENETIGIPPGRQTLRRNHPYAKALDDDKTMYYYGIEKETTIFLGLDEFKIQVDFAWEEVGKKGNTYNVWVKRTDTVTILRKKIKAVMSSYNYEFASTICPALPGYTVKWDENVQTVEQCDIKKGHAFQYQRKMDKQNEVNFRKREHAKTEQVVGRDGGRRKTSDERHRRLTAGARRAPANQSTTCGSRADFFRSP
ncbi:hypothetical protein niasHT_031785 [Heterodera trifolii]|uniref:Ubiquitin-like domain-containing protein n=1 Tax=Heterodera trifolii TaxID=157864 RepID=A0ABD2IJZ7_9BILA